MPSVTLSGLSGPWKLLVTGFILILGAGYLAGALNAALSVGISVADIADHYGAQSLSVEESAAMGEMGFIEEEFSFDDLDVEAMPLESAAPTSISAQQMAGLAHVHLLGFAMILLSAGALACMTGFSDPLKGALVGGLFLSLGLDIGGLYLVRFVSSGFAALNMLAGMAIGVCLLIIFVRVLWELWLAPANNEG
jgi:hypothetical protein